MYSYPKESDFKRWGGFVKGKKLSTGNPVLQLISIRDLILKY